MARSRRTTSRRTTSRDGGESPYNLPEPELVVVVSADAGVRAAPSGVTAEAADASALEKAFRGGTLTPLFGLPEERLRYEAAESAALGATDLPDLSVFYRLEGASGNLETTAENLLENEAVVAAYVKPPAEPPQFLNDMVPTGDAPPATPDFTARQIYLNAAPAGIDARYAWTIPGGRGAGVRIIDIEGEWRFGHEDLRLNQGGMIGGQAANNLGWRNHGTAVIGEFGGDVSPFGITGICPDSNTRAISIFGPGMGSAAAIRQAANALSAGDIILIELHRPGPRFAFATRGDQRGYIAVEWWEDDFAAIRYAFGRGVIVVEAAGNGAENLDDPIYNTRPPGFPASWTNPFNRANRDSGAIVVGAGAPPPGTHGRSHGPDRSRLDFSNWGALIDAQGWGREVTTAGYGDLQGGASEDLWYTDQFSGTSSASPIVVGALGCLRGVARARGRALTPAQARALLRATGSPQQDAPGRPASQRIGSRPNLRQLIARVKGKEIKELKELAKDRKELKIEKVEKLERKELKEKGEAKDTKDLKNEKLERKEKIEIKERKLELEKIKPEQEKIRDKVQDKLREVKLREIEDKLQDKLREVKLREIDVIRPTEEGMSGYGDSVEARLDALEGLVQELTHFISADLRPDLGEGALSGEEDVLWSEELGGDDAEAKNAKDAKDIEKTGEY